MQTTRTFNLQEATNEWLKTNTDNLNITEEDKEEMLDHFRSTILQLQNKGLSDEEAFIVAKIRFGGSEHWGEDFEKVSSDNFQIKKIISFFYGVMVYFIIYLGILFFINGSYMLLARFGNISREFVEKLYPLIYIAIYIVIPVVMYSLYRHRKKVLPFLKRKQLNFKKLLGTFALLLMVLTGERFTRMLMLNVRKRFADYEAWRDVGYYVRRLQPDFDFYFPMIVVISFAFMYLLYRKNNQA